MKPLDSAREQMSEVMANRAATITKSETKRICEAALEAGFEHAEISLPNGVVFKFRTSKADDTTLNPLDKFRQKNNGKSKI
jgi:hypothetical protein